MFVCVQVYVVLCKPDKETGFPGAGVSLAVSCLLSMLGAALGPLLKQRAHVTVEPSRQLVFLFVFFFFNTDMDPEYNRTCCFHLIELLLYCCLWISRNKASMLRNVGAWDESGSEFSTKWILCSRNIWLLFCGLCGNRRRGEGGGEGGER